MIKTPIFRPGVWLFVLLLAFSGLLAQVQRRPPQRPVVPARPQQRQPEYFQWLKSRQDLQDFSRLILKNGLRLLVAENHENPMGLLSVHIAEPRSLPGEPGYWAPPAMIRSLFSGTQKRTAKQIADQSWNLGLQLASECGPDGIKLLVQFPSDQVNRAVDLVSDLLSAPVFPEAAFADVQSALIVHEGRLWTRVASGGAYAYPWSGNQGRTSWEQVEQGIRQLTRSQVLDLWNRSAVAGQITVLIYGDFLPESVLDFSVRRLKDIPATRGAGPSAEPRKTVPSPAAAKEAVFHYQQLRSPITRSIVRVAFPIPGRKDPDYPALLLASYALAEGRMSFLARQLIDVKKIGFSVARQFAAFGNTEGQLGLQVEAANADLDSLEIELFSALERWRTTPRSEADRSRALALAASDFFRRMQTYAGRAGALLRYELEGGYKNWAQELQALAKVSPEDMTRVVDRYLSFKRAEVTELLPADGEPRNYTTDVFRQTFERILGAAAQEAPKADSAADVRRQSVDIPALIGKYASTEVAPAPYRTSILRGPELQIWELHSLPLVDLGIFFPGSLDKEAAQKSGLTRLLLGTLLRNSSKYSYEERFVALEQWGGRVEAVVDKDFFGYKLQVLAPFAEEALGLLLDVVRNRTFVDQDVEEQLRLQRGEALTLADSLEFRLASAADKQLYAGHPYGIDRVGPGSELQGIKAAQLLEWHSAVLEDLLPMVAVIGDTPGTALATYFSKHFSGSRYKVVKSAIGPTAVPNEPQSVAMNLAWQGQQGMAVTLLGPEGENEEILLVQMAMLAASRRLAGSAGMLATELGDSWSAAGLTMASKGGRILLTSFQPQSDSADPRKALTEALAAVESRESLEGLKDAFSARLRAGMQLREEMLMKLARGYYSLGQFYSVSVWVEKADAVNLAEYQEAVGRYFSQKQQVFITLGKR